MGVDSSWSLPTSIFFSSSDNHPYSSSISSSASSSASSLFSLGGASQASSASSTSSLHVVWETETPASQDCPSHLTPASCSKPKLPALSSTTQCAVPPDQRLNPRRTSRSSLDSGSGCPKVGCPRPPSLVRQCDRKVNFVDNLVDTAAQIVEVIWPLSVIACTRSATLGNKGILPLRTFIQETLRRSRTSYSTLQVALYYLIVVQSHIPKHDFTMEQPEDGPSLRALQCGRRMFLSALILASKYLQDRNFSARAWSKISGLNTQEINMNEMTFLTAVNWRLHISESVFSRWTDIVIKYTTSSHQPPSPTGSPQPTWRDIIPMLTPELDHAALGPAVCVSSGPNKHPSTNLPSLHRASGAGRIVGDASNQSVPTPMYSIPRVLEPPALPAFSLLPRSGTCSLRSSAQPVGFNTPAASAGSLSSRPSICSAMAQAQNACTVDRWIIPQPSSVASTPSWSAVPHSYNNFRRSSLARSCSSTSSPESMISDVSTPPSSRSSRSSSISSVSSTICAPSNQANLAIQATCRNAKLSQLIKDNMKSTVWESNEECLYASGMELLSSPETYVSPAGPVPDFTNFSLSTPTTTLRESVTDPRSRKEFIASRNCRSQPTPATVKCKKRGRTSEDLNLQENVRSLLSSTSSEIGSGQGPLKQEFSTITTSLPPNPSITFDEKTMQPPFRHSPSRVALLKNMGRKRACCSEEAGVAMSQGRMSGPGMWEGIL